MEREPELREEVFGPVTILVPLADRDEALRLVAAVPGSLTWTVVCAVDPHTPDTWAQPVLAALAHIAGRLVVNGVPTGVAVVDAQHHGGPYPASTAALHTSVGSAAAARFLRPIALQNLPDHLTPELLSAPGPRKDTSDD